jgi:transcriptional regulator with XRE-family HTH domain
MNNHRQNKSSIALTKIICARLKESRELCGLTVAEASSLMRIEHKLLLDYESGNSGNYSSLKFPLWLLLLASGTYDVSIDWLFGQTSDWDSSLERQCDRDLLTTLNKQYLLEAQATRLELVRQDNRLKVLAATVTLLPLYLRRITDAFKRYRELNPDFDDRLGSNTLLSVIEETVVVSHKANCELVRWHCLPKESLFSLGINRGP